MKAVMGTCERIVVLNFGQKLAEGTPRRSASSADVIEAYLGARTSRMLEVRNLRVRYGTVEAVQGRVVPGRRTGRSSASSGRTAPARRRACEP